MTKFEQLGLKESILKGLDDLGFEEAFPIQEAAIPVLLSGRDVIGQAHTGSGKTAAFALSMLEKIEPTKEIQGLVLAPTRELALQITDEIKKFGRHTGCRVTAIYGGQGMGVQFDALDRGVEILVATPGRLIDHLKRGSISLKKVTHVVLDEADTMLDMGFFDDVKYILELTPKDKVISLFSATMPVEILRLSEEYLRNPKQFLLDADDLSGEGIEQAFLVIKDREKIDHLLDFLEKNSPQQAIVFCSTKNRVRDVAHYLHREGINSVAIEGDMTQNRREQSMSRFRQGKAEVLVATDVAARGIDVPRVALVINYDVPNQEMVYFHRIGRTARAGTKGRAITFVSYSSIGDFSIIKRQIKTSMIDLNKEMGIEINIPDPLKREVPSRRYGGHQNRERHSGSSFRRDRGENRFRSERSSFRDRPYRGGQQGNRRFDRRDDRKDDRDSRGEPRENRSYNRSSRPGQRRYSNLRSRW